MDSWNEMYFTLQDPDAQQKQELLDWIGAVLGEKLPAGPFEKVLKDGVILCK